MSTISWSKRIREGSDDLRSVSGELFLIERDLDHFQSDAEKLSRRLQTLQERRLGLINSLSWRAGAPLRLLQHLLLGVMRRLRNWSNPERDSFAASENRNYAWTGSYDLGCPGPLAIDVSRVHFFDCGTGIQRVVRRITESALQNSPGSIVPIDLRNGAVHDLTDYMLGKKETRNLPREIHRMSQLVMLDGSWDIYPKITPLLERCHKLGIEVVTCVYDLIPIDFPETCKRDVVTEFVRWLDLALRHSDALVCISEATARRLEVYIKSRPDREMRATRIGWWSLGIDLAGFSPETSPGENFVPPGPYCLAVGTLEPRKNHRFLLGVFDRWWRESEFPGHLVIAGRMGWQTEDLLESIKSHPEFGRRLWWFPDVSDQHLCDLYSQCAVVLMPSLAEGFGLPVVEGARFHKPVVLSDIPVFREIVLEGGNFFAPGDEGSFRKALTSAMAENAPPTRVRDVTWQESADELIRLMRDNTYQIRLE